MAIGAALAGLLLTFSFEYANHSPAPHGVKIRVVAAGPVVRHVAAGLQKAAPGGFSVSSAPSISSARNAVLQQKASGALILPVRGRAQILTAQAGGVTLEQVVDRALSAVATAATRQVVSTDLAPLPAQDRSGLSAFIYGLGLLIPGVLGMLGIYLVGLHARLWWRVAAGVIYSLLAALLGAILLDAGFGALSGAFASTFAIGAFGALSFVLFVAACQASLGVPGTGLAAVTLIFFGNAVSGGTTPTPLLPEVYRQISPWMPNSAIVHGVKAVVYFNGYGAAQPVVALGIWIAAAVVLLVMNDIAHVSELKLTSEPTSRIYAKPGVQHVANKIKRHRRLRRLAAGT